MAVGKHPYSNGYDEGYADGEAEGYQSGREAGFKDGEWYRAQVAQHLIDSLHNQIEFWKDLLRDAIDTIEDFDERHEMIQDLQEWLDDDDEDDSRLISKLTREDVRRWWLDADLRKQLNQK